MAASGIQLDVLHVELSTMEVHYVLQRIENVLDMLHGLYPKLDKSSTDEEVAELEAAKGKLRQALYR